MSRTLLWQVAVGLLFSQTYTPPFYTITTAAGTNAVGDGGTFRDAVLLYPEDMAVDAQGAIYVADTGHHRIRKLDPSGTVSTVAGTGVAGFSGDGAAATQARLNFPRGVALSGTTLYFSDSENHVVRTINLQTGTINTFAGKNGQAGSSGDSGPARDALLNRPWGIAFDTQGGVLIADSGNNRLRRVTGGTIANFAGNGLRGNLGEGNTATLATLNEPRGVMLGIDQAIYFSDYGNRLLRRVLPNGTLQTVAGRGPVEGSGNTGEVGSALESLIDPAGFTIEASGNIVIADPPRHRLRRINTNAGTIDYLAGTGLPGFAGDGAPGEAATLNGPAAVAVDSRGNVIFADRNNHRIRRIVGGADRLGGTMDTLAGKGRGFGDGGAALAAAFTFPEGAGVAPDGTVYVADTGGHCVRSISLSGVIQTFAGICGSQGNSGDTGPAAQAKLNGPTAVAVSREGFVYIADTGNDRVRRVAPNGVLSTVAGGVGLVRPRGLTIDPDDQYLYFTNDFEGSRISRHLMSRPGDFQTFAGGLGRIGFDGDGGAASLAVFNSPSDVAMDRQFNLWVMDRGNSRLRRIERSGLVSTVLQVPGGQRLAVDASGAVFITQVNAGEHRALRLAPGASSTETLAGGEPTLAGDGSFSVTGRFDQPTGLAVAPNGRVLVADRNNHRLRALVPVTAQRLEIKSGNNQSAVAGFPAAQPLEVRLTLSGGTPLPGAAVTFAVQSGPATVVTPQAPTDADGVASTVVNLGPRAGAAVVTASFGTLEPARFTLNATEPTVPVVTTRPRIAPGGVVGVANSVPAVRALSTNALISIYGENFAVPGTGRRVRTEEFVNGRLPVQFLGVCVTIDGQRAPLVDVFPNQLNVQVPALTAAATAQVRVAVNCGTPSELTSEPETLPVKAASPELLYLLTNTDGANPVAAVNAVTGALIGPRDLIPSAIAARPGDVVTIYGSGFGPVNPTVAPGELPAGVARVAGPVSLRLGGVDVPASDISYVGVAPSTVIYQINFRVPATAADGRLPLVLTIGGEASAPGAYLTVAR